MGVLVLAAGLLLQEDVGLAQQVLLQLVLEGLVAGLGEEHVYCRLHDLNLPPKNPMLTK